MVTRDSSSNIKMSRCAEPQTLISLPLLQSTLLCWQSYLDPNLHDWLKSSLPSCHRLWSSLWHEVAPCSHYQYYSPWQRKFCLRLSSDVPARSLLGQFWYAWKHVNTSSRDLKICPTFSTTFLMLEWAKDIIFLQWVQRSYLWSYNSALFHCLSLVCFSQFGRWENKKRSLFAIICLQGCQANLSAFMSCCFFLQCLYGVMAYSRWILKACTLQWITEVMESIHHPITVFLPLVLKPNGFCNPSECGSSNFFDVCWLAAQ